MSSPLDVDYYTDVLCVWAWIAQHRIDEIEKEWAIKFAYDTIASMYSVTL